MNKTLRNKALKDCTRLITADFNGENWATPDGYFATAYPIYDGYRVKKSQYTIDQKPNLSMVLAKHLFNQETTTERIKIDDTPANVAGVNIVRVYLKDDQDIATASLLDVKYYDLVMDIYPDAVVRRNLWRMDPVGFYQDNTLVAVIMPLRG